VCTASGQPGSSVPIIVGVVVAIVVVAAIIVVVVVVIIFIRRRHRLINTREIKLFLVSNGVMVTLIYYRRQVVCKAISSSVILADCFLVDCLLANLEWRKESVRADRSGWQ